MDTDRIEIFHITDCDGGVIGIPHDLVLDLLVALDGLLNKGLGNGRQGQGVLYDLAKLLFIIGKAAAGPSKRICGPYNDRIAYLPGRIKAFFYRVYNN